MSEIVEIVVHGCSTPNAAAVRAAARVAEAAAALTGSIAHSRPLFKCRDTAVVDGEVRDVLVYIVKTWTRDDAADDGNANDHRMYR